MNTRRNIGSDGKLYSTTDNRDYGKYRVLNNDELQYELQQSVEIKTAMLSTGRLADSRLKRPHSASRSISGSASFCAPMFGTASRSNRIEKRAWNKEASKTRGSTEYNTYSGTMSKLMANSAKLETSTDGIYNERRTYTDNFGSKPSDERRCATNDNDIIVTERSRRGADLDHVGHRGRNVNGHMRSQSPANGDRGYNYDNNSDLDENTLKVNKTPLTSVMNALKLKYEQNLDVIGKLFDEKLSMEKLVQDLDHQLLTARKELASPRYAAARGEDSLSSSFLAPSSSSSRVVEENVDNRKNLNLFSGHRANMDNVERSDSKMIASRLKYDGGKDLNLDDVEEYSRGARASRGGDRDRTEEPENQSSVIRTGTGYDDSDLLYPRCDREYDGDMMRDQLNSRSSADRGGHRGVAYHDYDHSESPKRGSYGSIDNESRIKDRTHTQAPPSPSYLASKQRTEGNSTAWDASTNRDRYNAGLSYTTNGTPSYESQTASSSSVDRPRPTSRPTSATSTYSRGRDSRKESRWPIDGRRSMSRSLSFDTPRISAHLQADQDR